MEKEMRGGGGERACGGVKPVARHSNPCMSKQDFQTYVEEVGEKNKEDEAQM